MGLFENLNIIDLGKTEVPVKSSKPSKITYSKGDAAFVVYNPSANEIDAFGVPLNDIESHARDYAEYLESIPEARLFILTKDDPRYLTSAIDIFKDAGIDENNLWIKIRNSLVIDPRSGEFTFAQVERGLNPAETPDVLKNASFSFQKFRSLEEFFDTLIENAKELKGENFLTDDEINYAKKKDWRGVTDAIPVLSLYSSFGTGGIDDSFAQESKNYEMIRSLFEQLDGKPNLAGHIVTLDGYEYVLLNCPQNFSDVIDKLEMPTPPVLFHRTKNFILPLRDQFKEMTQGVDTFTLARLSNWQNLFDFPAPVAKTEL